MNIDASLIAEAVAFAAFVWLTMKVIWPQITKAMDDRAGKIAEGLAAGERPRVAAKIRQMLSNRLRYRQESLPRVTFGNAPAGGRPRPRQINPANVRAGKKFPLCGNLWPLSRVSQAHQRGPVPREQR